MRIISWETTGTAGSVAALIDDRVLLERYLPDEQRSAQSLAPSIDALLAEVGWRPAEVELIATAVGPGSFTGLRVGVTTAKMFAYAVNCPLIGVNTLEAIAARCALPVRVTVRRTGCPAQTSLCRPLPEAGERVDARIAMRERRRCSMLTSGSTRSNRPMRSPAQRWHG